MNELIKQIYAQQLASVHDKYMEAVREYIRSPGQGNWLNAPSVYDF